MGLFDKKNPFQKFSERVTDFILANPKIDEEFLEELEEILIISDIGIETTEYIMEELRDKIKKKYIDVKHQSNTFSQSRTSSLVAA